MALNKSNGFALLLIGLGALMLLGLMGFGLGKLLGIIIPVAMVILGYIGVKNGRGIIGWALIVIGAVILLGKFSALIGWVVAAVLIVYGISLLRRGKI